VFGRKTSQAWRRRRLLALGGVGAALATNALSASPRVAEATGPVIGMNNYTGTADANADGVQGYAVGANNAGTFGRNNDLDGTGVYGAAPNGTGVHGESANGTGVGARSTSGNGVFATSTNAYGVYASSTNNYGVFGYGQGSTGYGILGHASNTIGVAGSSYGGQGVHAGATTGLALYADATSGTAVYATSSSGNAAVFVGPVQVQGPFTVTGGFPKSAAVPHPDGSHRRMYCLESPDSLFEDAGTGQLVAGRAQVRLDADFAALVKADNYQVFLTPEGDCKGLYVTAKTATTFEVRELQGGTSAVTFNFRVLAKRKDLTVSRLERVEIAPRQDSSRLTLPDEVPQTSAPGTRSTPTPPSSSTRTTAPASTATATTSPTPTATSASSPTAMPQATPGTPTSPTPVSPPNPT
jgi:hypothetical protein